MTNANACRRAGPAARPARRLLIPVLAISLIALSGCTPASSPSTAPVITADPGPSRSSSRSTPSADQPLSVIVVQGAEHTGNDADDAPLSSVGSARAKRLAALLADRPGVAVFVNQYQSNQSTGLPTARQWNVAPSLYDAGQSAVRVVATVRSQYRGGEVLLVGQRETVPALADALCSCAVDTIPQDNFSTLLRIDFDTRTGRPTVARRSDY